MILEDFHKIEKSLRIADHMVYITYPLIKDPHLLKNILEQLHSIANKLVEFILDYEIKQKKIKSKSLSLEENFSILLNCSSNFRISKEEFENLKELIEIGFKQKNSITEFTRKERLVFMFNSKIQSISLEQLKKYLTNLKTIIKKTKEKMQHDKNDKYKYDFKQ